MMNRDTKKKKILLLAYYFNSKTEVGALRPRSFAETLIEQGYHVDVLCREEADEESFSNEIRLIRVKERQDPLNYCWHLLKKISIFKKTESQVVENELLKTVRDKEHFEESVKNMSFFKRMIQSSKRIYLSFDAMYSGMKFWCLSALLKLLWMRFKGQKYDVIISSCPPDALNLVALLYKKLIGCDWICDMRDPFYRYDNSPIMKRSRMRTYFEHGLVNKTLKNAKYITVTTPSYFEAVGSMLTESNQSSDKKQLIYNGYDADYWGKYKKNNSDISIVYAGIFYNFRSPFEFLESVANLKSDEKFENTTITAHFFGDCDSYNGTDLRNWCVERNIEENIRFHGKVPRESLHQYYLEADILLILAQNQPVQLPGKTFEYLAYDAQILGVAEADSVTNQFINRNEIGVCVESDVQEITQQLKNMLLKRTPDIKNELNYNKGLFKRSLQNEKLLKLISE